MSKDWRLEHLETQPYLRGVAFARKPYREYRPGWAHDHCVACWAKLEAESSDSEPDSLHEGYATTDSFVRGAEYEWVCVPCFEEFAATMAWVDETPDPRTLASG
jgi:hypothetical protein